MDGLKIFQREGSVTCDFAGLQTKIEAYLAPYEAKEFTEDDLPIAKKDLADIRKSRKEFDQARKDAKAEYMKPWETFEGKCLEMLNLYDRTIVRIDGKVDEFIAKKKEEKDARIKEIFGEMVFEDDILAFLPLEKVYNEKWKNSTYSEKQIKEDIMTQKIKVKEGLAAIKAFESDVEEKALVVFKETLSLPEAIKVITDYEANKKVFKAKVAEETRAEVIDTFIPVDTGEEAKGHNYTIYLTRDSKEKLEAFMDSVGIDYMERR